MRFYFAFAELAAEVEVSLTASSESTSPGRNHGRHGEFMTSELKTHLSGGDPTSAATGRVSGDDH